jgi:hypothetical protein
MTESGKSFPGITDLVSEGSGQTVSIRWTTVGIYAASTVLSSLVGALMRHPFGIGIYGSGSLPASLLGWVVSLLVFAVWISSYFLLCRITVVASTKALGQPQALWRDGLTFSWKAIAFVILVLAPILLAGMVSTVAAWALGSGLSSIPLLIGFGASIWLFMRLAYAPIAASVGRDMSFRQSFDVSKGLSFRVFFALLIPTILIAITWYVGGLVLSLVTHSMLSGITDDVLLTLLSYLGPPVILGAILSYILSIWQIGIFARLYNVQFTDAETTAERLQTMDAELS